MKILISKLPESGWWQGGIPKYADNPAMVEGAVPDMQLIKVERNNLINCIKETGNEVIEINFPDKLDEEIPQHDFVFVRDSFISNQNGIAVILRACIPERRIENKIIIEYLEGLNIQIVKIADKSGIKADGGEFYFCKENNVLFSGLNRNTLSGIEQVAQAMNVNKVIVLKGEGFHLDTFFSPVLGKNGEIVALIICNDLLGHDSKKELEIFSSSHGIPILDIPPEDAIGVKGNVGNFAVNALALPGALIRPNHFTNNRIEKELGLLGVKQIITPTSQFQLSGGSVHCLTNEI